MKRILALGLCLALLCPAARAAEEAKGWSRSEPGGDYVTLRVKHHFPHKEQGLFPNLP